MESIPCAMAQVLYHDGPCTCSTCVNLCQKVGLQGRANFLPNCWRYIALAGYSGLWTPIQRSFSMKTQSSLRTIQILEKCFEFKMMLDYLVSGLFSTNAVNSKCWKIIQYQEFESTNIMINISTEIPRFPYWVVGSPLVKDVVEDLEEYLENVDYLKSSTTSSLKRCRWFKIIDMLDNRQISPNRNCSTLAIPWCFHKISRTFDGISTSIIWQKYHPPHLKHRHIFPLLHHSHNNSDRVMRMGGDTGIFLWRRKKIEKRYHFGEVVRVTKSRDFCVFHNLKK